MTDMSRQVAFVEADAVACDAEIAAATQTLAVLRAKRQQLDGAKDRIRSGMLDLALTQIESMTAAQPAAAAPQNGGGGPPAPLRSDSALATKLRINRQWKLHRIELHLAAQRLRLLKMPPSTDQTLTLPDEVMMMVLGHLLVPELAVAATACRRWHRLARTTPLRMLWDEHRMFAKYRRSTKHHPRRLLMDARNAEESRWGPHPGARPHGYPTSPVLLVDSRSGAIATIKGDRTSYDDFGEQKIVSTSVYVWGSEADWASGRPPEVLGAPWRTDFNVTAMSFTHSKDDYNADTLVLMTAGWAAPHEGPFLQRVVRTWRCQIEGKRVDLIDDTEPDWVLVERYSIGGDFRHGAIVALSASKDGDGVVVAASRHGEICMWTGPDPSPYEHRKFMARHHQAPGLHPPFQQKHLALSPGGTLATIAGGAVIFWVAPASLGPGVDRVMTEPQGQGRRGAADEDILSIQWSKANWSKGKRPQGALENLYGGSASGSVVEWSSAGNPLRVFDCNFPASMQHGDLGLLNRKHADLVSEQFYNGLCETVRGCFDGLTPPEASRDSPRSSQSGSEPSSPPPVGDRVPSRERVRRREENHQREWEVQLEGALDACCEEIAALEEFPGMLQLVEERVGDMPAYAGLEQARKDEMISIQRQSIVSWEGSLRVRRETVCELAVGAQVIYAGSSEGRVFKIPLDGGDVLPFVLDELTAPFALAAGWDDPNALLSSTISNRRSISIWGPTDMRARCKMCLEYGAVLVESQCDDWDEAAFQRALSSGSDVLCDDCKEDFCENCNEELLYRGCAMCPTGVIYCAGCDESDHCTGCQKWFCSDCLTVPDAAAAKISNACSAFANRVRVQHGLSTGCRGRGSMLCPVGTSDDLYDATDPYCRECITTHFKTMKDSEECPVCGSIQDVTNMDGCGECNALCCKLCVNKSANTKPGVVHDRDAPFRLSEVTRTLVWVSEAGNIRARDDLPPCSACGREKDDIV